jgi:hypothetical protein
MTQKTMHSVTFNPMWFYFCGINYVPVSERYPAIAQCASKCLYLGKTLFSTLEVMRTKFLFTLILPCLLVFCTKKAKGFSVSSSSNNSNDSFTVTFVLSRSANPHYSVGLSNLLTHFTFQSSA